MYTHSTVSTHSVQHRRFSDDCKLSLYNDEVEGFIEALVGFWVFRASLTDSVPLLQAPGGGTREEGGKVDI